MRQRVTVAAGEAFVCPACSCPSAVEKPISVQVAREFDLPVFVLECLSCGAASRINTVYGSIAVDAFVEGNVVTWYESFEQGDVL